MPLVACLAPSALAVRRESVSGLVLDLWLADNSLIDDDAADRFLAGHPDPDLP